MKKAIYAIIILAMAFTAACSAPLAEPSTETPSATATEAPAIVTFTDPVLEAQVREVMGKPEGDITIAEAEAVTELVMNNEWPPPEEVITDISSLKYFPNLTRLEFMFNGVSDISVLGELPKLQLLGMGGNQISDISVLAKLPGMDSLQIWGNQIADLSPLAGMSRLHVLMIGGCPVTDISVMANFKELTILDITTCPVSDISSLAGLPLTTLRLSGCPITDFSSVADRYDRLEEKDFEILSAENVPDEPLVFADPAFEKALRTAMGIPEGPITQKDAYVVQTLELFNEKTEETVFSDISPLAYFVNLKSLIFNANRISDLSPLTGLTKLTRLEIGFNLITDISPLLGMTQMEQLVLRNNQISDISALSGMTNLWQLWISDNQITDVSALSGMTKLGSLQIANNPIGDYSPLTDIYPNLTDKDFEME